MAASVRTEGTFETGSATPLFKTRLAGLGSLITSPIATNYAVSANGRRFLMASMTEEIPPASVTVLSNWPAALRSH
jgi:hypothetical protein